MRHRRTTTALACLGAALILAGGLISYGGHVVSNSTQFATRATSVLGDAGMRALIARRVTSELVAKRSELIALRPVVESAVGTIVGSAPFQSIFEGAVYDLHRSVFVNSSNTFTLRLADVGVLAETAARTFAPSLAAKLPASVGTTLKVVASGDFRQLSDVARTIDRARDAGIWVFVAGVLLLVVSVAVARERALALSRAGAAILAVGLLVVVLLTIARPLVLNRFAAGDARTAAGAMWNAFLSDVRVWALLTAAVGALAMAVASVIRAPRRESLLASAQRVLSGRASGSGELAVVATGLIGAGLIGLTAPATFLSAFAVLAGAGMLYAGIRRLLLLAMSLDVHRRVRAAPGAAAASVTRLPWLRLGLVVVVAAAGAAAAVALTHGEPALPHPIEACNGYAELCDKRISDVAFAATHNSMASATDSGWLFPAQDDGIPGQLNAGVRGLLIDTHYGIKSARGVTTHLTEQTEKLAKVVDAVGPEFLASVDRLRSAIGFHNGGRATVYLCHAFCEVGATPARDALGQIRDFLVRHPDQVLILSVEDDVTPQDTAAVFAQSGLLDLVYQGPSGPWPTLKQLIEQDRRVIVFAENHGGGIPWYRPQFKLMQETPYRFTSVNQVKDAASCRPNRGGTGKPLFLLNNWVDTSPAPRPANADTVNSFDVLLERARRCQSERHRVPNLVAVDFYRRGDLLRVVAKLNGVG